MNYSANIEKAIVFAATAHLGQKRRGNNIDYIVHPMAVMHIISEYTDNEDVLIAALCHDVVEDTKVKMETIADTFGDTVAKYVQELTLNFESGWEECYREEKKRIQTTSQEALLIRMGDIAHNSFGVLTLVKQMGVNAFELFHGTPEQQVMNTIERYAAIKKVVEDHPLLEFIKSTIEQIAELSHLDSCNLSK